MLTPKELLVQFLTSDDRLELLADDVEYRLPVSLWEGLAGLHKGKPAVTEMLTRVFTEFYDLSTLDPVVDVLVGDDDYATVFFTMNARTVWGEQYTNDYCMTIKGENGKITKVYELFDTKNTFDTLDASKLG
jgi:ketosteroid isomerase-like protein